MELSKLGIFGGILLLGILIGWVWPVEGPIDYIYDESVGNRTIKAPVVSIPAQQKKDYLLDGANVEDIKEILIDLNEDGEQEWYLFMPLLKGAK